MATKVSIDDRDLPEKSQTLPHFSEKNDCSNMICASTTESYEGHVEKLIAVYFPAQPRSKEQLEK